MLTRSKRGSVDETSNGIVENRIIELSKKENIKIRPLVKNGNVPQDNNINREREKIERLEKIKIFKERERKKKEREQKKKEREEDKYKKRSRKRDPTEIEPEANFKRRKEEIPEKEEQEDNMSQSLEEFIVNGDNEDISESLRSEEEDKEFDREFEDRESLPSDILQELDSLQKEMDDEFPDEKMILTSNITRNDKKKCLRLLEQMRSCEEHSQDYYRAVDSINDILAKSKNYTAEEIEFLENEENKLRMSYFNEDDLKTQILRLQTTSDIKGKILSMYDTMLTYPPDSTTYNSLKEEIEWAIKLPYDRKIEDHWSNLKGKELNKFLVDVRKKLDAELYGMEMVKERLIHILINRRGRNIALVGPPGVGKTAICKAFASIMGKKFAKISAASLDSAAIKGSNKVYISAEPSIILQMMASMKTNNIAVLVDEADKMEEKTQYAFLHMADASDNAHFQDAYLKNFYHDLSNVTFMYNLNSTEGLHPAFLDRLDIINVSDYTDEEKGIILHQYMFPKIMKEAGIEVKNVILNYDDCYRFILGLKADSRSLRNVEKRCRNIVSKIVLYMRASLPDGTLGDIKISYKIPNFKLPLKMNHILLSELSKN